MSDGSQDVLVVGGGLAGLAAASALAEHGLRVTIVEARHQLGGRASSFKDPAFEQRIDNCQHVSMGCCTNLKDFCRRMGTEPLLSRQRWLYFQDERGRVSRFGAWPLPCPLHLAPSFALARFLTLSDKLRIAYGFYRLLRQPCVAEPNNFLQWLRANGQTQRTCDRFWSVILVSALNETLENIDYRYARQVFVEGFLWHRDSSVVEIPRTTLGEFYGQSVLDWLADHGVEVRFHSAVRRLEFDAGRVRSCSLRSGEDLTASDYILAVPFHRVQDLLPEETVHQHPQFADLARLRSSPITSVHLWFDRPVMQWPHLVPVGRNVQWLFVHQSEQATFASEKVQYVQAVISAARELAELGNENVFEIVYDEVKQILPDCAKAQLLHHRVVTERSATYSVVPGVDAWRPAQQTPIANLWLAGDYTQTGWPATMEGAVKSGYHAAEKILASRGIPAQFVQGPLPLSRLTGLVLRD